MIITKISKKLKYSDLSSKEQAKIIKKSAREANEDQLSLINEFDKRFGKLQHAE
ncbi:MAG: hypothetical protein WCL13_02020 [bacterium]